MLGKDTWAELRRQCDGEVNTEIWLRQALALNKVRWPAAVRKAGEGCVVFLDICTCRACDPHEQFR